ncbi:MAG: helix-turn-helix transcriptional regulator [Chitinophagales bacterium]|nr:helix-turn-helix transcriptional regulator [Chitinophagaceae bacterium]MCB9065814.1 helix-turn-helix transcriptional regulator [Chitinophagales bacterium]
MEFLQHKPSEELAQHVETIMFFSGFMPDHEVERVVPTGHAFIIFELDGYTRHTFDNDTLKPNGTFTKVWISGLHRNYLSISAHTDSSMFVIQFKPHGAYPFLHKHMIELAEKIVPAEEVLGDDILHLRDDITSATTPNEKFGLAEQWLKQRYKPELNPSTDLLDIINRLQQEPVSNLNNIIEHFPHSQKHLIDLFKKYLGLTPKYYQRILRFNEIMQRIQHKEKVAWTDIAYSCGYSDQSHFIKEFKHFSGFNPKEFIDQSHNSQSNFFPIDTSG